MKRTKPANHLWRCHGGETEPLCRVWGNPDKGQERCFFSEAWRAGGKDDGEGLRYDLEFLCGIRSAWGEDPEEGWGVGQPLLGKEGRAGSSMQRGGQGGAQAYILTGDRKAPPQLSESPG